MTDRIAAHVWVDGKCIHCKLPETDSDHSCVFRDPPPRPKPSSIFDDLTAIGARRLEIRAEEDKALAGKN